MKTKKDSLSKVAHAVKSVAQCTAQVAGDFVVQPVGKALGLIETNVAPQSKSSKKAERKAAIARATSGKHR